MCGLTAGAPDCLKRTWRCFWDARAGRKFLAMSALPGSQVLKPCLPTRPFSVYLLGNCLPEYMNRHAPQFKAERGHFLRTSMVRTPMPVQRANVSSLLQSLRHTNHSKQFMFEQSQVTLRVLAVYPVSGGFGFVVF